MSTNDTVNEAILRDKVKELDRQLWALATNTEAKKDKKHTQWFSGVYNDTLNTLPIGSMLSIDPITLKGLEIYNRIYESYSLGTEYNIQDEFKVGNCLFTCLAIVWLSSVRILRETVANNITIEQYELYREYYTASIDNMLNLLLIACYYEPAIDPDIITPQDIALKAIKWGLNRQPLKEKRDDMFKLKLESEQHKQFYKKQKAAIEQLWSQNKWIDTVNNFQEFQQYILSPAYWGDEVALSILERRYKYKFIILRKDIYASCYRESRRTNNHYLIQEKKNTMISLVDGIPLTKQQGYVIFQLYKEHYSLVLYKQNCRFTFATLPKFLKDYIEQELDK